MRTVFLLRLIVVALLAHHAICFSSSAGAATTTFRRSTTRIVASGSDDFYAGRSPMVNNRHSSSDWLYNMRSIPQSTILKEVRGPVLAASAWSLVVAVLHRVLRSSASPLLQSVAQHMSIPATAHSFLMSALGLLLVFRTNSAYQRFLEGRKIWEEILNVSRNLSRMVQLYSADFGAHRAQRILQLVAAYPYLLRHHIRPGCLCQDKGSIQKDFRLKLNEPCVDKVETRHEGDKACGGRVTPEAPPKSRFCWVDRRNLPWRLFDDASMKKVSGSNNRPLWVCDRIGREVMGVPYGSNYSSRERLALLGFVDKLTNAIGNCERIHQTAVPLNYARHSLRSLAIWLFTLPFAIVKDTGLLTPFATAVSAWVLYGIYQIGYSIEDPFQGSLRLSILCDSIRQDVLGISDQNPDRTSAYSLEDWDAPVQVTVHPLPISQELLILSNPPRFVLEKNNSFVLKTNS